MNQEFDTPAWREHVLDAARKFRAKISDLSGPVTKASEQLVNGYLTELHLAVFTRSPEDGGEPGLTASDIAKDSNRAALAKIEDANEPRIITDFPKNIS